MSLNTVTLKWNITDLIQGGQTATLVITPTAQLTDTTGHELVSAGVSRRVTFSGGQGQMAGIVANDNAISPPNAGYTIEVVTATGQVIVPQFTTQLLYASAVSGVLWLDQLAIVPVVATAYQYLPLPAGTPAAGMVPVATGTSEASAWGSPTVTPDSTATDIAALGAQSAGSTGKLADAGHVHPYAGWLPSDNGLLAACDSPAAISSTFIVVKGVQYMMKVPVRAPFTATTIWFIVSAAGSGASTGSFVGLMSPSGALLTGSADCASAFTGANTQSVALATPQALTPGSTPFVWVVFLANLASTQPTFRTAGTATSALPNLNLAAASFRGASQGSGSTTALTSVTPSSNSATPLIWAGIS